jgi:hypothetical protein
MLQLILTNQLSIAVEFLKRNGISRRHAYIGNVTARS